MRLITMLSRADLLLSRIGLVGACALGAAAILVLFGVEQLSGTCEVAANCGVALAIVVGALHNAVLWQRFGFFLKGLSFKELYDQCPRFLIFLAIGGLASFMGLLSLRTSARVSGGYAALVIASFLVAWFSMSLGQITSLLYGANPSFHRTCAKYRAGR